MGQKQPVEILQIEPWSNGACRGYVIHAMENAGFAHKDIQRVVDELHWVFDRKSIDEADEHYRNSSY